MRFSLASKSTRSITLRSLLRNWVQSFTKIGFIVFIWLFCFACEVLTKLNLFFCIDCSDSDNDRLVSFVFIETLHFVMLLFITFKAFDATQIVRVTNFVDSLARRRRIFKSIELLASNKLVGLVWATILIRFV